MIANDKDDQLTIDDRFSAARKEIEYRSNAQTQLLVLMFTAASLVTGLVIRSGSSVDRVPFLVLLVLIAPALGMLWLDHANTIERLGDYCCKLGYDWEHSVKKQRRALCNRLLFGIQIYLVFGGTGLIALLITYHERDMSRGMPNDLVDWGWNLGAIWWAVFSVFFLPHTVARPARKIWRIFRLSMRRRWARNFSRRESELNTNVLPEGSVGSLQSPQVETSPPSVAGEQQSSYPSAEPRP